MSAVDWRATAQLLCDAINSFMTAPIDGVKLAPPSCPFHLHDDDGSIGSFETALEGDHPDCELCNRGRAKGAEFDAKTPHDRAAPTSQPEDGLMDRASLTVVLTNGVRLDAMMLTPTWRDGDGHPMLSFICSGRSVSYPLEEVRSVELHSGLQARCGMCEQSLPRERPSSPVVVGP